MVQVATHLGAPLLSEGCVPSLLREARFLLWHISFQGDLDCIGQRGLWDVPVFSQGHPSAWLLSSGSAVHVPSLQVDLFAWGISLVFGSLSLPVQTG